MLLDFLNDSRILQTDEVKESCGGQYVCTFTLVLSQVDSASHADLERPFTPDWLIPLIQPVSLPV